MLDKATQREGPPPENSNLGDLGTLKDTLGGDISRTLMSRLRTGADIACREHSCIRTHASVHPHAHTHVHSPVHPRARARVCRRLRRSSQHYTSSTAARRRSRFFACPHARAHAHVYVETSRAKRKRSSTMRRTSSPCHRLALSAPPSALPSALRLSSGHRRVQPSSTRHGAPSSPRRRCGHASSSRVRRALCSR